jgi:hypothetical protein
MQMKRKRTEFLFHKNSFQILYMQGQTRPEPVGVQPVRWYRAFNFKRPQNIYVLVVYIQYFLVKNIATAHVHVLRPSRFV